MTNSLLSPLKKELTHTILLHPSYFGPRMLSFLESKLYGDVEGTCSGQFGYIIAVVSILDIGKGMVLSGSGQAEFITRYRAIVFKPFKGEVVDGVVNNVNKPVPTADYLSRTLLSSPPQDKKIDTSRKLLILDLNGVLLKRRPLNMGVGNRGKRIIWPRPYVQTFRSYLFHEDTRDWLDTMVWSSAKPDNVAKMVDACFRETKLMLLEVWARDKMGLSHEAYNTKSRTLKNMNAVWRYVQKHGYYPHSQYTTLLMDDSYDKARLQPYNHVVVPEYTLDLRERDVSVLRDLESGRGKLGGRYDDTLLCAVGILEAVKKQENVAHWIRHGGLRLGKDVGQVEAGAQGEAEAWCVDPKMREHWKERGMAVLDEMKIELKPAVWP
ncbi:hypothetical protein C0991_008685 [Blastosporella zonata]|nr:hypothetical protein C0991_008685 [Blastosporella zonata]